MTKPRRQLSIRQILVAITGALTLIITLFAIRDSYDSWLSLTNIQALKDASTRSDQLFDAAEQLSLERDIALSMLQSGDRDTIENLRPRLLESRQGADEKLRASVAALSAFRFPELAGMSSRIDAHLSAIALLRPRIDEATQAPSRDRILAGQWLSEVSALLQESDGLWTGFIAHFTDADPLVTQHLWLKHYLRTITDYTGRERSLIGQLIAENADPKPEDVADLQRGQAILALSWETSRMLAQQSNLFPAIGSDFTDANSHYSTMHDMVQTLFSVPKARGATYPISADLWFELSTEASDSLADLRNATIGATRAHLDRLISGKEREIFGAFAIFGLALLLCAYSFRIVIRRVVQPIDRMVEALLATMPDGEIDITAPIAEQDEIGKLAVVLRGFQQTVEDVKRTSAELARSQTHLRAVIDNAVVGLFTTDADGNVKNFNPAGEAMFGYDAADVVGRSIALLMPELESAGMDAYVANESQAAQPAMSSHSHELTARRKDGSTFPVEFSVSKFTLESGLHYSAILRDITQRKQAQEELARHTAALERSNKELDDFAYIASHDLKEPLRGIHNHSRFLLEDNEGKLDTESVGRLNRLTYLSQRMEKLVNDLLYFSRLGRQELAVQATDLNAIIRDIESTLDIFLGERGARITIPKELPVIVCDKPRVAELFRNLITNAVKYNDKTEKIIEIGYLPSKQMQDGRDAANVYFVRDNGRGIGREFHQEIFRIFRRLQSAQDNEEGTGVGLTFVKKIVERHGGSIWLESEPGAGTTFFFTLEEQHHDADGSSKVAA